MRDDPKISKKSEQFVKLRMTFLRNADIGLFDFDFDQTWMAFFLDADGHVLSRYGSRDAASSESHNSTEGLLDIMDRVLALSKELNALSGPRLPGPASRSPADLPGLHQLGYAGSCVRCHMVHEAMYEQKRRDRKLQPSDLWRYPVPETIGLTMDSKFGNVVRAVAADSFAARAGMKPGDEIHRANGAHVLSIADLEHVLNGVPSKTQLTLQVERATRLRIMTLDLDGDWKRWDVSWRKSVRMLTHRQSAFVRGLALVAGGDRKKLGIDQDAIGFRLMNSMGEAQRAGLEKDDIVIAFDGKKKVPYREPQLYMYIEHKSGDKMEVTVLRNGKEQTVTLIVP